MASRAPGTCYVPRVSENPRTRNVTIRRVRVGAEEERADREFWHRLTPEERVLESWRITCELWELKGWDLGEPGLHRSVARVVRR